MQSFATVWSDQFAGRPPIDHIRGMRGTSRWVRFHSLPESKRYADTADELAGLLARQNALATRVLGDGAPCWLAQCCWYNGQGRLDTDDPAFGACKAHGLSFAFPFETGSDEDDDRLTWHVYAAEVIWKPGAFDTLLVDIAYEQAAPAFWMSQKDGALFAPYDGGIDLELPSKAMVDCLKRVFASWLPTNPMGL